MDEDVARVAVCWSGGRRLRRVLVWAGASLVASVLLPLPLVCLGTPVAYLIGVAAVGTAAIPWVARRVAAEEARAMVREGPFIEVGAGRVRWPVRGLDVPVDALTVQSWRVASKSTGTGAGRVTTPASIQLRLQGGGLDHLLVGQGGPDVPEAWPLRSHDEAAAASAGAEVVLVDIDGLCRARRWLARRRPAPLPEGGVMHVPMNALRLEALLREGLDPDVRDEGGRTLLMVYGRSAAENRVLLAAGARLEAVDARGRGVLWHQAMGMPTSAGYVAPDFAALQVLVDGGVPRPGLAEVESWKAEVAASVTSGAEANDAARFAAWLDARVGSGAELE